MRKIKIGVDLDSTLSDFLPYWINKYNINYQDNLIASNITKWETHTFTKPECGTKIYDILLDRGFFRHVPVLPKSQLAIEWLSNFDDVEIYVATAYHPYVCKDKADWLADFYPTIDQKNIIFCNNKSLLDLDYLWDDAIHNGEGFKGKFLLMDYPHNQSCGDKYTRVKDGQEVIKFFKDEFKRLGLI